MGTDIRSELAVMDRLRSLADASAAEMDVCDDLATCDLLVVHQDSSLRRAADRIIRDRPSLPLWLLDDNGALTDGSRTPGVPLSGRDIRNALRRIMEEAPAERGPGPRTSTALSDRTAMEPADGGLVRESATSDDQDTAARRRLAADLHQRVSVRSGAAALELDGHPVALLDFASDIAVPGIDTNGEAGRLEQVLAEAFNRLVLQPLPPGHVTPPGADDPSSLPLGQLLWRTGLRLDGTTLLPGTAAIRLLAWPDFRMIARKHDHFRLCSLLLRRACTPSTAARLLDLPPASVHAFFNAAWLSGHCEPAQPVIVPEAAARQRAGALLASMWRRVRGRTTG